MRREPKVSGLGLCKEKTAYSSYRSVNPIEKLPYTVYTTVLPPVLLLEKSANFSFRDDVYTPRVISLTFSFSR